VCGCVCVVSPAASIRAGREKGSKDALGPRDLATLAPCLSACLLAYSDGTRRFFFFGRPSLKKKSSVPTSVVNQNPVLLSGTRRTEQGERCLRTMTGELHKCACSDATLKIKTQNPGSVQIWGGGLAALVGYVHVQREEDLEMDIPYSCDQRSPSVDEVDPNGFAVSRRRIEEPCGARRRYSSGHDITSRGSYRVSCKSPGRCAEKEG